MTWISLALTLFLAAWVEGRGNDVVYMHETFNNETEEQLSFCPQLPQCHCLKKGSKRIIDCSSRQLRQLPSFSAMIGQEYDTILLSNNEFSRILKGAFHGLSVRRMVLSNNTLRPPSDNGFNELKMLEELVMDNCSLSSTPVGFNSLIKLKRLELQNNKIRQINSNSFERMHRLEYLDLSGNPIVITAPFDEFRNLTRVKTLLMENCGFHNIPHDAIGHMTKLKILNLSKNNIWKIPANFFTSMTDLVTLDLFENPIEFNSKDRIFGSLNKLQVLKLGGCMCEDQRLHRNFIANLKRLKTLTIRSCDIHQIEEAMFSHLGHLQVLDLGGNHFILKSDIFRGVSDTIEKLYLDDAGLFKFPYHIFEPFSRLKHLYVRDNQIDMLPAHVFRTLEVDGVHVYLQRNKIKKISGKVLQWSPRPIYLHLEDNRLKTLSFLEKDPCLFQLATIYLKGNNVSCNCDIFKAVQMKAFTLLGKCSRPNEFNGLHLSWRPDSDKDEDMFVEHNVTSCNLPTRLEQRYECTCRTWMAWDSPKTCGVVGVADRPMSLAAPTVFASVASLLVCFYLR